jgi:hypothetical protein
LGAFERSPGVVGSPDSFPSKLESSQVLAVNNADASEITRLLTALADQLVAGDLSKLDVNSEEYWRTWERIFEASRDTLVGLSKKVTLTIKTPFIDTNIKF